MASGIPAVNACEASTVARATASIAFARSVQDPRNPAFWRSTAPSYALRAREYAARPRRGGGSAVR